MKLTTLMITTAYAKSWTKTKLNQISNLNKEELRLMFPKQESLTYHHLQNNRPH